MSVRAKFKFNGYEASQHSTLKYNPDGTQAKDDRGYPLYDAVEMRTLKFSPVYGNGDPNHENSKFWKATPSGELRLGTINPEAWSQFELGEEYYLDFTKA